MSKKGGLGKGLNSLIPDNHVNVSNKNNVNKSTTEKSKKQEVKEVIKEVIKEVPVVKEVVKEVPVVKEVEVVKEVPTDIMVNLTDIEPNRKQPRKQFDEDALNELAESIKQVGMIQPIVVQKKNDYYEIIAGERRWRAAKIAGLKEVPVIVKDYTEQEIVEIALIENIQRESLNPIEEAKAYRMLIDEYHLLQDQVAEKVSKSRSAITNSMRLLKLCEKVQDMMIDKMITSGHARALIPISNPELQYATAMKVFDNNLSVRETEKLVKQVLNPKSDTNDKKLETDKNEIFYKEISGKLATVVGTKVKINNKKDGKGKIEIEYYSQEELERIYHMIMHSED